ncbi:MAG: hypothetical protein HY300_13685 [Verrucomicrobia bacterium]|nr:hypothetical protein [Verrucomicrobiota bacterium]
MNRLTKQEQLVLVILALLLLAGLAVKTARTPRPPVPSNTQTDAVRHAQEPQR